MGNILDTSDLLINISTWYQWRKFDNIRQWKKAMENCISSLLIFRYTTYTVSVLFLLVLRTGFCIVTKMVSILSHVLSHDKYLFYSMKPEITKLKENIFIYSKTNWIASFKALQTIYIQSPMCVVQNSNSHFL